LSKIRWYFVGILTLASVGLATLLFPQSQSMPRRSSAELAAPRKPKIAPRSAYVGDQACAECHKDRFNTYEKTAHHLTSQLANKNTMLGTFAPGTNIMTTANPDLTFRMDQKGNEFFQSAIWTSPDGGPPRTRTERLDLVIGSGGKGQTYLYWRDSQLFQLPAGYSTVFHRWIISPGYIDGQADFERAVIPRAAARSGGHVATLPRLPPGRIFANARENRRADQPELHRLPYAQARLQSRLHRH
jgi:hypothetical protein